MIEIVINRKQDFTQTPCAYIGYSMNGMAVGECRKIADISSGTPIFRIIYQESPGSAEWAKRLDGLQRLKEGWDGEGAPAPTQTAIITAKNLVENLVKQDTSPNRIAPSVIGGIGITRKAAGRRVYIEIYNDGRTYALFSDGLTEPEAQEVEPGYKSFKELIAKMRSYLDA